jgi:hypothetical protein
MNLLHRELALVSKYTYKNVWAASVMYTDITVHWTPWWKFRTTYSFQGEYQSKRGDDVTYTIAPQAKALIEQLFEWQTAEDARVHESLNKSSL